MACGNALPCMHQWQLSLHSDFPLAYFFFTFEYRLLNDTVLLSDPAHAVCHSARSAGEISAVVCHALAGSRA